MRKALLLAALLVPGAAGCVLHHTESDTDAVRYAGVWETPRLGQQPVLFNFRAEGDYPDHARLKQEALDILFDSGKFRLATAQDEPAYTIDLILVTRRKTHVFKTLCNALLLYALPIDAQDHIVEAIAYVRRPSGELVGHCYAQSRGKTTLWLGYLLWPKWLWNSETEEIIRRDTLKAVTVKACRALMPKAGK